MGMRYEKNEKINGRKAESIDMQGIHGLRSKVLILPFLFAVR